MIDKLHNKPPLPSERLSGGVLAYTKDKKFKLIISPAVVHTNFYPDFGYLHAAAIRPGNGRLEEPVRQPVAILIEAVVFLLFDPHLRRPRQSELTDVRVR